MTIGILVPLIAILILVITGYVLYQRKMSAMALDDEAREVPGTRLTSETLRRLAVPPWRVVYEIRPTQLEGADHVVIGPCGVIALTTVVADRPTIQPDSVSSFVATTALLRAAIDQHTDILGVRCDRVAKVFWGAPHPELPAARDGTNGTIEVEGQRLEQWLYSLPPGPLSTTQVDGVWRAIVLGIGRPDPGP